MVPFLGHRDSAQPLACRAGRVISAGEFLADVESLAARLPARTYTANLCRDRYCFAVAFAAAMVRKQIVLLPATQALESLRELRRQYESVYLLVDDEENREADSVRVSVGAGSLASAPNKLAFAADVTAAIAFTSGTTGTPVPNAKRWGELALGATSEASRFGLLDDAAKVVVGTVPPQHMYGLESTVMMALRGGLIMHSERPFFPADMQAALASVDAERVLVSTPVHLRALLESEVHLPPLRLVICATAPLREETARRFEARFGVEVQEVYGFTEAGMVATRRTVDGPNWRLLADVEMRKAGERVWFSGGHVPAEVASGDVIDVIDAEHFVLLGRGSDLVNIAGKRTSIGYLEHQLCGIAGVQDAAFLVPNEAGDDVTRLTAFVVAPGIERSQLLRALSRLVDPVFLPRPLYFVESLPRNSSGKLPRDELNKLAQACARAAAPQTVVVKRSIDPSHPALAGHFPGDPVVPGVVLLDEIVEAVSSAPGMCFDTAAMTIRSVKFLRPVRPGECLQIKLTPGENGIVRFVCTVADEIAINGSLAAVQTGKQ